MRLALLTLPVVEKLNEFAKTPRDPKIAERFTQLGPTLVAD
jgi:hypothetical protein